PPPLFAPPGPSTAFRKTACAGAAAQRIHSSRHCCHAGHGRPLVGSWPGVSWNRNRPRRRAPSCGSRCAARRRWWSEGMPLLRGAGKSVALAVPHEARVLAAVEHEIADAARAAGSDIDPAAEEVAGLHVRLAGRQIDPDLAAVAAAEIGVLDRGHVIGDAVAIEVALGDREVALGI